MRVANDHLYGTELFIRFTMHIFMNVYQFVCARASFPFGFEGGMWNLFTGILVPDYCTARQC